MSPRLSFLPSSSSRRSGARRPSIRRSSARLERLHRTYTGRPSIITEVPRFAEHCGGARIILKREDLNHTGSHKINNVLGQALLTKRMGKARVIAETGAGPARRGHGDRRSALLGLECVVYMGKKDTERQALNVARMRLLGAEVVPVEHGTQTLKDAVNEAFRDWVANVATTHYVLGTVTGPHPFPGDGPRVPPRSSGSRPARRCSTSSGDSRRRVRLRRWRLQRDGHLPPVHRRRLGAPRRPRGRRVGRRLRQACGPLLHRHPGRAARRLHLRPQDEDGQTIESHSVSAASTTRASDRSTPHLRESGRAEYRPITDVEAMEAFRLLSRTEGILPAIESSHALAGRCSSASELGPDAVILVNLSGRGDKDVHTAASGSV